MENKVNAHITTAAQYNVTQPYTTFERAVQAVVRRVHQEGLKSVLHYQFYGHPPSAKAGAIITYTDADAWLKHHEIVPHREELKAFQMTVKLEAYLLYGRVSPAISALLHNAQLPHAHLGHHVAGFARRQQPQRDQTASAQLTTVTQYELIKPHEDYEAAIQALAHRTEREGCQDLLTYQFYLDPDSSTAGGVISYADSNVFVEHHQLVAPWEEYATFKATHRLVDIKVYGQVSAQARDMLQQANLLDKHIGSHIAGFVRD